MLHTKHSSHCTSGFTWNTVHTEHCSHQTSPGFTLNTVHTELLRGSHQTWFTTNVLLGPHCLLLDILSKAAPIPCAIYLLILLPTDTNGHMTLSRGADRSADPCVLIIVSAPEVSPLLSEGTIDVNWGRGSSLPPCPLPSLPHPCPSPSPAKRPQLSGGPQWMVAPRNPHSHWLSYLLNDYKEGCGRRSTSCTLGYSMDSAHLINSCTYTDTFTRNRRGRSKVRAARHPTFCRACFSVHCMAFLRKTGLLYLNSED